MSHIEKVSFDIANKYGDIISQMEPEKIISMKKHIEDIGRGFNYPLFHNGLVLNFLLFQTNHWDRHEILQLNEWKRIQSISDMSKNIFSVGCSEIKDNIGVDNLEQLVDTLSSMRYLSTNPALSFSSIRDPR